jgi:5-methylcytosine-specific restriction endonuclease McrA
VAKRGTCPNFRRRLTNRQGGRCYYCRSRMGGPGELREATIDHVIPKAGGGTDRLSNLVAACRLCNAAKGDLSAAAFLEVLAEFDREQACG